MKTQVILKNLQWLGRHNPAFPLGSVQTAVAELLNPTSSIQPYSGRLCLDKPAIVCTGTKYFNIDAGKTKNVNFQILMPTTEGTYPVHLDIFSNSELLEAYRADEDVVVGLLRYTLEVTVEPPRTGYVTKSPSKTTYSAGEVVTLTAHPYSGYEFDHWGGWPPYPGIQSTSPTLNLTMTDDWWVVAAFREVAPPPPPPPPPPPVYTCPYCGAQFATYYERTLHEGVCPKKPPPPPTVYYCPYCSAQFATIDGLYSHIASVHPGWPW